MPPPGGVAIAGIKVWTHWLGGWVCLAPGGGSRGDGRLGGLVRPVEAEYCVVAGQAASVFVDEPIAARGSGDSELAVERVSLACLGRLV